MKLVASNDFANVRKLGIRLPGHAEAVLIKDEAAKKEALSKIYPHGNTLHIPKGARFEIAPDVSDVKDLNAEDAENVLTLIYANKAVLDVPNCAKAIAKIDAEVKTENASKAKREALVAGASTASPKDLLEAIALLKTLAASMAAAQPKPAAA